MEMPRIHRALPPRGMCPSFMRPAAAMKHRPVVSPAPCTQHCKRRVLPGTIKTHTRIRGRLHQTLKQLRALPPRHNTIPLSPTPTHPHLTIPTPHTKLRPLCTKPRSTSLVHHPAHQSRTRPSICSLQHTPPCLHLDLFRTRRHLGLRRNPFITSNRRPIRRHLHIRRWPLANRERIRRAKRNTNPRLRSPRARWRRA